MRAGQEPEGTITMGLKAVKFGGSSLASASQIMKAAAILASEPDRRYLVASAPGKRSGSDAKITDLLYQLYQQRGGDYGPTLALIKTRYTEIADELGVNVDLNTEFVTIEEHLTAADDAQYFASRGEYLNSLLIAAYLGWTFVDAAAVIRFTDSGDLDADQTDRLLKEALLTVDRAVVPGFYGATAQGKIRTFSRGGSDVTGALVASAVGADVYENWTDVSGILMADPRIVDSPGPIARISFTDLRKLTYLGASVLHEDAINPVRVLGIPINIRNTNRPLDEGTWIQADAGTPDSTVDPQSTIPAIIGLAGKTGYTAVTVHKAQWSGSVGVGSGLLRLFDEAQIIVDLVMTSVDTYTFAFRCDPTSLESLLIRIGTLDPDSVEIRDGLALIGAVSSRTVASAVVSARLAQAMAAAEIEVVVASSGDDTHIVAVDESDYKEALRGAYLGLT
ncbi:MAG: aspartate kinase [Propionibacteriaceae bacterium]|nr:aspartate kinase [Propionibacteriaceae bacterium]